MGLKDLLNRNDMGHVLAPGKCESLDSHLNFSEPLKTPVTFGQGLTLFLKKYFPCVAEIMSPMPQEQKLWPVFSGV